MKKFLAILVLGYRIIWDKLETEEINQRTDQYERRKHK